MVVPTASRIFRYKKGASAWDTHTLVVCVYPALLRYAITTNARHRRLEPVRGDKGERGEPAEAIRRKEHAKAEEVERRVPKREVMPGYV